MLSYFSRLMNVSLLAAALLLGGGCRPRTEYETGALRLERIGWDSLRVAPSFVRRTSFGEAQPVQPDTTRVHVFDASYDTLYAGPAAGPAAGPVALPDRRLGSREALMVEACGVFGRYTLCEQRGLHASPKRTRLQESRISFPEGPDFRRGTYDVQFTVERRAFEGDAWEHIEREAPAGAYLRAYVEGRKEGVVTVPLEEGEGRFDLARHDGYRDFRFHLQSTLDPPVRNTSTATGSSDTLHTATVAFEVYAGAPGAEAPQPVARTRKQVRRKTPAERRAEAEGWARQAGRAIARRLHEDRGEGDWEEEWNETEVRATVRDWTYDRFDGRYEIDLRVRWRERGDHDRYTLEGTLKVAEDGREARFTGERGNRRTVRRWRREVEGDVLFLGTLEKQKPAKDEAQAGIEDERFSRWTGRRSPS